MSNKTMKQRIALVAASALTAGFLSVVAAPAANAAVPAASTLFVASAASTTGTAVVTGGDEDNLRSVGWVARTNAVGTAYANAPAAGLRLTSGEAGAANVLTGAQIAFSVQNAAAADADTSIVVTGGTLSQVTLVGSGGTLSLNGSATIATLVGDNDNTSEGITGVLTLNVAAGSTASITAYGGTTITALTPTNGTLIGTISLTAVAASASGTFDAAKSSAFVQPAISAGGTSSDTNAFDTTTRLDNGQVGVIRVLTRDAYLGAVTGQLNASASAGNVQITNSNVAAADTYAATSSFDTEASWDGDGYIVVRQPVANTAGSSTVTITLDGAVIFTKTVNWNGIAATVDLVAANSASIFSNGYAPGAGNAIAADGRNADVFYVVKDAAGNALTVSDAATNLSISDQTGSLVGASIVQGDVTGTLAAGDLTAVLQTKSLGYGVATMNVPSTSLRGAGTYRLAYVNSAGATIKSAVINATVSGAAHTFTASWDKASYAPGDIATLTISAKDSAGNPIADGVALGSNSLITTNTDGLASVTSSCDSANIATTTFSGGKKECKFAVKNTPGSYAFTATIPTATSQAATAGTVKVTDSSGAVSNADVLKSIVALIASINKQIQALQKLILRR